MSFRTELPAFTSMPHTPSRRFLCLYIASLLWLPSMGRTESPASSPPPIRRITIQGNTRTRTEVIRRELLFSIGELLDSSLVAETGRNLRQLLFLSQADIDIQEEEEGVAILIKVEDLYSRALSPLFSGEIDELSYGLVALDYNFLGRGQTTRLTLSHHAISGNRATVYYRIPRLGGRRETLITQLGLSDEGHEAQLTFSRPFYALSARWAYGISLFSQESVERLYAEQHLAARYTDRLDGASMWLVHSRGDRVKFRPSLQLSLSDRRFESTLDSTFTPPHSGLTQSLNYTYAPQDRRRVLPLLGLLIWRPRYEQARFLHFLGQIEDVQIGSWLSLGLGLSHRMLGSDQSFGLYQVQLAPRFKSGSDRYTFVSLLLSARQRRAGYYHVLASAEVRAYARIRGIHSLAGRLRGDALSRPEDHSQLLLGLDQGLRGYPPRRFDGTRQLLFNLEARPTFFRHPLYVLAGALFVDGGTAWTPGHSSPHLNLALGTGLRVGLPRVYNTPVLRADLAYGLGDATGQLSFSLGQYF